MNERAYSSADFINVIVTLSICFYVFIQRNCHYPEPTTYVCMYVCMYVWMDVICQFMKWRMRKVTSRPLNSTEMCNKRNKMMNKSCQTVLIEAQWNRLIFKCFCCFFTNGCCLKKRLLDTDFKRCCSQDPKVQDQD